MSRNPHYEPLELDLDWGDEPLTMPSIPTTRIPPSSGIEWVKRSGEGDAESWGLEWVDDIAEDPLMFAPNEGDTSLETPDAKKRDTMRAAPPPPGGSSAPASRVTVPSLLPGRRQERMISDVVAAVSAQRCI